MRMGGKDKDRDNEEGYELFKKGTQVEVSTDEERFRGAWFQATIISSPSKSNPKGKALVQYRSLLSDDACKPLAEYVEASLIRPLPPPQGIDQSFEPHDVVDASYSDGWWKGVVTKVTIFKENNNSSKRYSVVFEEPPDQMEFSRSDLRFHWEWINGKWVRPPKQKDRFISSYCPEQLADANNNAKSTEEAMQSAEKAMQLGITGATEDRIELTISRPNSSMKPAEQSTPCTENSESKMAKMTTSNCEATLLRPSKKLKTENLTNLLNSSAYHLDSMPIEMPEQEAPVIDGTVTRCSNHLVVGTEVSAESECPFIKKNVDANQHEAARKDEMMVYLVNRKRLPNSPAKSQQIPKAGGEDTPEQDSIEDIVEAQHTAAKELNLSVILAEGTRGSDSKPSCQPPDEVFLEDITNKDSIEDTVGVEDTAAKELGSSVILAEGTRSLSPKTSCQLPDEEINLQSEGYTRQQQKGDKHDLAVASIAEMNFEDSAIKEVELPRIVGVGPAGATRDMSDIVPSTIYLAKGADLVMAETSFSTSTDGQQISSCIEGYSSDNTLNQWNGTGERQVETVMRSPVVNVPGNQMMPFIKNSSIWEKVESLEVFQHMPQKPHFLPLASYKEVSREGFALGHMVTFATLADKTSKLQVDDPKNLFKSYLDTLADWEMLGFEVKAVFDRLTKLLSIKDKLGQLQDRSEEAQIQIIECIHKKSELGEEIDAIDSN